jgi:hypothetical protein
MRFTAKFRLAIAALVLLTACATAADGPSSQRLAPGNATTRPIVHALFDLGSPARSPFPADHFTVADLNTVTGLRVQLPMPADCVSSASDCSEITELNELDGFSVRPRVSIPFDGTST